MCGSKTGSCGIAMAMIHSDVAVRDGSTFMVYTCVHPHSTMYKDDTLAVSFFLYFLLLFIADFRTKNIQGQ